MNRLTHDEQEKLRIFKNSYIERDITQSVVDDFERLRENQVIGGKQICMLLTGDTGAGKTSFIDYYKENFIADADSPRTTKVSVLISRIPPRPSLETTILELLKDLGQFGTAYRLKDNRALNLTAALVGLLKKCKVELIILDEFQELIEYLSEKKRNDIANRLKLISEDAGVPIVLVGMPWADRITEDPQWASRLMLRKKLSYFKISTQPRRQEYIDFLTQISKKLPFKSLTSLGTREFAFPLFAASRGVPRELKEFIYEAVRQALLGGAYKLMKIHFSKGFSLIRPDEINPFEQELQDIKTSEVESYSKHNPHITDSSDAITATRFTDKLPISQILSKTSGR